MKTKMQFVMNKGKGALAVVLSVLLLNSVMDYSGVVSVRAAAGDASGSAGGVFSEAEALRGTRQEQRMDSRPLWQRCPGLRVLTDRRLRK